MLVLMLAAGLALAEPETPPALHSVEVTETYPDPDPVEIGETVEIDPTLVSPEEQDAGPPPTPFQRVVSGLVWFVGLFIAAPYADEALTLIFAGLFGEIRLRLDRRRRPAMLPVQEPGALGALEERRLRNLMEPMIERDVALKIDTVINLQQTEIATLRNERDERERQHREQVDALTKVNRSLLEIGLGHSAPPNTPDPV